MLTPSTFFSRKNVLVTGATGYLGTAVVEKLLRSFPQINKIYCMTRARKEDSFEGRTRKYFNSKAFKGYLETGRLHSKVKWIQCDFGKPDLNLAMDDVSSIIENVNVIIHCASLMNFKAPLRQAAAVNISGTQTLLEIAMKCSNLESFVYVSSAYTNALNHGDIIDETLGPYKANRDEIFAKLKSHDDATIKVQYKNWIGSWGNTYILTKNATENLVHEYKNVIPVGIYRPGLVLHAFAEPYPYWEQCSYGLVKILPYVQKGLLVPVSDFTPLIFSPVDICANGLIAATTDVSKNSSAIKFYNCTNSNNLLTARECFDYVLEGLRSEEIIPIHYLTAKKMYSKENQEVEKYAYSIKHLLHSNFTWLNKNFEQLWESLDSDDKDLLFCDLNAINWKDYFTKMFQHTNKNM